MDRRTFLGSAVAALTMLGCGNGPVDAGAYASGRLTARPGNPTTSRGAGKQPLRLGADRDGFVFVPSVRKLGGNPLMVLLHGAGQRATEMERFTADAEALGIVLLAPDSRAGSWDVIRSDFGPDVEFIDRALLQVFGSVRINERIGIAGFSDGASYALSLGLTNGDFFSHIAAFSPGFMVPSGTPGKPGIFVTHGDNDPILPVTASRDVIVPQLKAAGYSVQYHEFNGGHFMPGDLTRRAMEWFVA